MLQITHNGGFFSCCTVRLFRILDYFNEHKSLPTVVDSSVQFFWYKVNKCEDITYTYFKPYDTSNIEYTGDVHITNEKREEQFSNYNNVEYASLAPFVEKYFSPSDTILCHINEIEETYNISDYHNICVLFYRGNDKIIETPLCSYDDIITKAYLVLEENPNVRFLVQSDETEFIERILDEFPNKSFYLKDHIRHITKCMSSVDKGWHDSNYMFSQYYLAITIIMSKCNYLVFGSGNCSLWIVLYRGHAKNMYQFLNNEWV